MKLLLRRALLFAISWVQVTNWSHAEIVVGHVDDFQDGTTQDWRIGQPSSFPKVVANAGPLGSGDFALFTTNNQQGARALLVVLNEPSEAVPGPGNWQGDWTTAGVTQVSLDVRNPGTTVGASNLTMRLGISGPGGTGAFGDVYITPGKIVPPDNSWHSLTFDVRATDFIAAGMGTNIAAALADVQQFRILSNPNAEFPGSGMPNEFYVDNIRAIGNFTVLAGDYDQNGAVDAADYVLWRNTLEQPVPPGSGADGTGPAGVPDGVVTGLDYEFWRARFGNAAGNSSTLLGQSSVPEPTSWVLLASVSFIANGRLIRRATR